MSPAPWRKLVLGDRGVEYLVTWDQDRRGEWRYTCACPSWRFRRVECKHIRRAKLAHERERTMEERDRSVEVEEEEFGGIHSRWIVNLKGKNYPTWPGVLDLATRKGLKGIETTLVQAPTPENGHLCIVSALATFEDGRTFACLGDASPASVGQHLANAIVRFAETRAKGRALRDACNVGHVLAEELPHEERNAGRGEAPAARTEARPPTRQATPEQPPRGVQPGEMVCAECRKPLTKGQYDLSVRVYQVPLCPTHQSGAERAA